MRMRMSTALFAGVLLLSGCGVKTSSVSELPANPKMAEYGVVVVTGKAGLIETSASELVGEKIVFQPVPIKYTFRTAEKSSGTYSFFEIPLTPEDDVGMIAVEPGEYIFFSGLGAGFHEPKRLSTLPLKDGRRLFRVNPGEVVYFGDIDTEYVNLKVFLSAKVGTYEKLVISDRHQKAWEYIEQTNVKDWPRRNVTSLLEFRPSGEFRVQTKQGCLDFQTAKDKGLSSDSGGMCDTGIAIEQINGETVTTYNDYGFGSIVAKQSIK